MSVDTRLGWLDGVFLDTKEAKILLDPSSGKAIEKGSQIFISHAHADHTYGFGSSSRKFATVETRRIHEEVKGREVKDSTEISTNRSIRVGDAEIIAIDAGHMLGSVQFKISLPEKTIVYTGDLNCVDTLTTVGAEAPECDELVMEATYGTPRYTFPNREETYARIVGWSLRQVRANRVPVFHVYAAGKAQEIIKLLNTYTKIPVVSDPTISRVNSAYRKHGNTLEYYDANSDDGLRVLERRKCVCVTTPHSRWTASESSARALATGWVMGSAVRHPFAFPLSSHADFRQLVQFARKTGAKRIYAFTGYTNTFTEHLRKKLNVDARPIPSFVQRRILDY